MLDVENLIFFLLLLDIGVEILLLSFLFFPPSVGCQVCFSFLLLPDIRCGYIAPYFPVSSFWRISDADISLFISTSVFFLLDTRCGDVVVNQLLLQELISGTGGENPRYVSPFPGESK
jgi:hypothetical protein